jgi:glycosyl hydrolase family 130 (putative beta-1,4-mannooligosaccharide phosphorylase)
MTVAPLPKRRESRTKRSFDHKTARSGSSPRCRTSAGVVSLRLEHANGRALLLCRAEDRRGLSHLCAARSVKGVDRWVIDPQPTLWPDAERYPEELWGIEDPRITAELRHYAITYTAFSRGGQGWRWRSPTTSSVSSGLVS